MEWQQKMHIAKKVAKNVENNLKFWINIIFVQLWLYFLCKFICNIKITFAAFIANNDFVMCGCSVDAP